MRISVQPESPGDLELCREAASRLGLCLNSDDPDLVLTVSNQNGLSLCCPQIDPKANLEISFTTGTNRHRRQFGGGKSQLIAKAVGIKSGNKPTVLDITAGLGRDAFVFASLGLDVVAIEKNPVLAYMLEVAKQNALENTSEISDDTLTATLERLEIVESDALELLSKARVNGKQFSAEVVYMDPMFPGRKKSAAVKKEMRILQELVGDDGSNDSFLLECALVHASHRVVVKRPRLAPAISGPKPSYALEGKSTRFDVYSLKSFG